MTDPIEVAARAICEADPLSPAPDAPIMWNGKRAKAWEPRAEILREALKAGLFCHPAKAWIAPMEATPGMVEAEGRVWWYGPEEQWRAARDAYLKEKQG